MSFHLASPTRTIPRVHLSPKIKNLTRNNVKKTKSPFKNIRRKSPIRKSPIRKSPRRSKVFILNRESFRTNPTVNPITNRQIKENGDTYKKLVKLYGKPY